jgi:putative ABC transport system substrate-binding protein
MRRRDLVKGIVGSTVGWPLAARAQQPERVRRIGALMGYADSDREAQTDVTAFREGLQKLGWAEGRNISIETRWAPPENAGARERFAKELVALQPDLVLSHTTPTTAALLRETRTIPVIFANVSDPIGSGFAASLSRPGGNVTGFTTIEGSMGGKWLELLKEISPHVNRVAFLFNPETATYAEYYLNLFKTAGTIFGVEATPAPVRDKSEIETVMATLAGRPNGGLVVMPDSFLTWRPVTMSPLSIRSVFLLKSAAYWPTEWTCLIILGARHYMPIASSRARSRASCPSRDRPSSSS